MDGSTVGGANANPNSRGWKQRTLVLLEPEDFPKTWNADFTLFSRQELDDLLCPSGRLKITDFQVVYTLPLSMDMLDYEREGLLCLHLMVRSGKSSKI